LGSKTLAILITSAIAIGACAQQVTRTPVPVSGSKADGTVEMAVDYAYGEQVTVDWIGATASAQQRCKAWGYSKAEPFGGQRDVCHSRNGYGWCLQGTVTYTYQCTN
jgi:hypothetical protein